MKKQFEFAKEKIHCEELLEKAWNWFNNLRQGEDEEIIMEAYMKKFGIKEEDVNW